MSTTFIKATANALDRHGIVGTYKVITEGTYDVNTGSASNTETSYTLKMYKKHIKASQYNYPELIGKDSAMFYILGYNLAFQPQSQDLIIFSGKTYKVDSVQSHMADGVVVLYRIMAVV